MGNPPNVVHTAKGSAGSISYPLGPSNLGCKEGPNEAGDERTQPRRASFNPLMIFVMLTGKLGCDITRLLSQDEFVVYDSNARSVHCLATLCRCDVSPKHSRLKRSEVRACCFSHPRQVPVTLPWNYAGIRLLSPVFPDLRQSLKCFR